MLFIVVMTTAKSGRPYFVAEINFSDDTELELWDKFYKVCATFHYRDIVALSRASEVAPIAVERWKHKLTFPRKEVARQIIDWVKRGKPMKKVIQRSKLDMF